MSSDFGCTQAIALGKTWLATCLENHLSCTKKARHAHIFCSDNSHFITDLSGDGLVPSRLLKFTTSPSSGDTEDVVRLVLSSELDEHTQYAALSHCWGSVEFSTTTNTQYQYRVTRQRWYTNHQSAQNLSRCRRDHKRHGLRREARRMAIIYDNAVFTIAPMDAANSSQGLFPGSEKRVNGLESRAWTCQERLVAPRTLNFTGQSVSWECRQGSVSAESESFVTHTGQSLTDCDKEGWIPPDRPKPIFEFFRDWRLPPKKTEDEDAEPSVPVIMLANTEPDVPRGHDDGSSLGERNIALGACEERIMKSANDDEVEEVSKQLSLDKASSGEESDQALDSEGLASPSPIFRSDDVGNIDQDNTNANEQDAEAPAWVWSDDTDAPCKIWNARPPLGESGIWFDHDSGTLFTFIGSDLPAHAAHVLTQIDYPIKDQQWIMQYDEPWGNDVDPFCQFQVFVRDLMRDQKAYYPLLRVWWNLIALYTPRSLTYDSDAFLAINGITSVAQRWTHLRNSFGLWLNFFQIELCWYIDPDVPASRPKSPEWLAPSWSWASTRQGKVKIAVYREWPAIPHLLIKPQIYVPVGTAFDMPLPMEAWRKSRYHDTELKGSLRKASVQRVHNDSGGHDFEVVVEPHSRYSDYEFYKFYPDVAEEFSVGNAVDVWVLPTWHFDGNDEGCKLVHHLDIMLVLHNVN
ncbi:hypothetical protein DE146DRAFT_253334 [Phaeosphaeria sp. MPI-PUGE-AT-0046c]|nr:hypothetical protein DE146DRAFT_253334 [Phaeosphaeria sp. MPI-PUGE-AT-0046c]